MKVEFAGNAVRIDVTDAEVGAMRTSPFAPQGHERCKQWALNVVRGMGLTPRADIHMGPIIRHKRGVSNRGFVATVWLNH